MTKTVFHISKGAWYLDNVKYVLALAALGLVIVLGMFGLGIKLHDTLAGENVKPATPVVDRIEEDEPGWDCKVHGNKICGPLYPA